MAEKRTDELVERTKQVRLKASEVKRKWTTRSDKS